MFNAADWALRRLLKFTVKRTLGRYLLCEPTLEQVDVQLGTGSLELRGVLFNCAAIESELDLPGWQLKKAYVGKICGRIPLTAMSTGSPNLELDEVLVTICPKKACPAQGPVRAEQNKDGVPVNNSVAARDGVAAGQVGVLEGIQEIAGGLEVMLQRLCVTAKNISIRLEIPPSSDQEVGSILFLHWDAIHYRDDSGATGRPQPNQHPSILQPNVQMPPVLTKTVSVTGFVVEVVSQEGGEGHKADGDMGRAGQEGRLSSWKAESYMEGPCTVEEVVGNEIQSWHDGGVWDQDGPDVILSGPGHSGVDASLTLKLTHPNQPLQHLHAELSVTSIWVQVCPRHLHVIKQLQEALALPQKPSATKAPSTTFPSGGERITAGGVNGRPQDWESRSLVEEMFFPHCDGLLTSSFLGMNEADRSYAGNVLQSRHARDSGMSARTSLSADDFYDAESVMSSSAGSLGGASIASGGSMTPSMYLTSYGHGLEKQSEQHPRDRDRKKKNNVLEWSAKAVATGLHLVLCYDAASTAHPSGCSGSYLGAYYQPRFVVECSDVSVAVEQTRHRKKVKLKLYQVEAAEHLPAGYAEDLGVTPHEYARVPQLVPGSVQARRSIPLLCRSGCGDAGGGPLSGVQVWPVCSFGDGRRSDGARPSVCLVGTLEGTGKGPGKREKLTTEVEMVPVTVWLELGALSRLCVFFDTLTSSGSTPPPEQGGQGPEEEEEGVQGNYVKTQVEQVIESILEDLHEVSRKSSLERTLSGGPLVGYDFTMTVTATHVCAVLVLPRLPGSSLDSLPDEGPASSQTLSVPSARKFIVMDVTAASSGASRGYGSAGRRLGVTGPVPSLQPLLLCRQYKEDEGVVSKDVGTCDLVLGSLRLFIVGKREGCVMDPILGTIPLEAACVLQSHPGKGSRNTDGSTMGPDDVPHGAALFATLQWDPSRLAQVNLVNEAWTQAGIHCKNRWADSEGVFWEQQFNSVSFREKFRQQSQLFVHVRAPAISVCVSRSELTVILQLAGYITAQAASVPLDTSVIPMQISTLLQCRVAGTFQSAADMEGLTSGASSFTENCSTGLGGSPWTSPVSTGSGQSGDARSPGLSTTGVARLMTYELQVEELTCFQVSSLGGCLGASASLVKVQGLTLTQGPSKACLLYCPIAPPRRGASQACIDIFAVTRPPHEEATNSCMRSSSGSHASATSGLPDTQGSFSTDRPAASAMCSVLVRGTTITMDYSQQPGMKWAEDLGKLFSGAVVPTPAPAQPQCPTKLVLNLEDIAIRYEPLSVPLRDEQKQLVHSYVSGVLLVEGVHWSQDPGCIDHEVHLHSIRVYLARAATRGPSFTRWWSPIDMHHVSLLSCHHHCLLQESHLGILLRPTRPCAHHAPPHLTWDLEITNQMLAGHLNQDSLALLIMLASHLAAAQAHTENNADGSAENTPEELVCSGMPPPLVMGLLEAPEGPHVLDDIQTNVFRVGREQQSKLKASVFVSGGWYNASSPEDCVFVTPLGSLERQSPVRDPPGAVQDDSIDRVDGWAASMCAAHRSNVGASSLEPVKSRFASQTDMDHTSYRPPVKSAMELSNGAAARSYLGSDFLRVTTLLEQDGHGLNGQARGLPNLVCCSPSSASPSHDWPGSSLAYGTSPQPFEQDGEEVSDVSRQAWYDLAAEFVTPRHTSEDHEDFNALVTNCGESDGSPRQVQVGPFLIDNYYTESSHSDAGHDGWDLDLDLDLGLDPVLLSEPAACVSAHTCTHEGGELLGSFLLQEDYIPREPRPRSDQQPDSGITGDTDVPSILKPCGGLALCPVLRVALRNVSLMMVFHEKKFGGRSHLGYEGRIELELGGANFSLETFPGGDHWAKRVAVSVQTVEVRDCLVRKDTGNSWGKILTYRDEGCSPRDDRSQMFVVVLDTVIPDPQGAPEVPEYRLSVSLLPLRLRLDQSVVTFLQVFSSAVSSTLSAVTLPEVDRSSKPDPPYFQRCEIKGFSLLIDYRPRRIDIAALRDGSFVELLNLVPWGGVDVTFKPVKLAGVEDWDGILSACAREWLHHIATTQAHKFVQGLAPVNSVCRVGSAVSSLLSVPANHLRRERGPAKPRDGKLTRQLRRSSVNFVRAVLCEALGLGASLAAGAQMMLQGGAGVQLEQPNGVMDGFKQAAEKLSEGFESATQQLVLQPMREVQNGDKVHDVVLKALRSAPSAALAPATAVAKAARCTLLGVRSAFDG